MNRTLRTILIALLVGAVAGCAAHRDPIVDMRGVDEEAFARDWAECESYSKEIEIGQGVARGGAAGAVIGGIAGAIDGEVEEGAGYGALYGGAQSGLDADREQQMVFKRCLVGRGYRVLN
ncbi:MAG: hypothetical protein QNI99_05830 [Woeseiaceae bacterium]|nr:hypothetical protein [Woeseiaceae bacterium]